MTGAELVHSQLVVPPGDHPKQSDPSVWAVVLGVVCMAHPPTDTLEVRDLVDSTGPPAGVKPSLRVDSRPLGPDRNLNARTNLLD